MKCAATRCGEARQRRNEFLLPYPQHPPSFSLLSSDVFLHPFHLIAHALHPTVLLSFSSRYSLSPLTLKTFSLSNIRPDILILLSSVSTSFSVSPCRGPVECRPVYRAVHLVAGSFARHGVHVNPGWFRRDLSHQGSFGFRTTWPGSSRRRKDTRDRISEGNRLG